MLNSSAVLKYIITVLCLIYEHIYLGILVPVKQGVSCVFIRARFTQILGPNSESPQDLILGLTKSWDPPLGPS